MTKGEELVLRYLKGGMNAQEIFEFRQEAREFFKSNAPEEDKRKLSGYMESVVMICRAIEENKVKGNELEKNEQANIEIKNEYTFKSIKIPDFLKQKIQSNAENK